MPYMKPLKQNNAKFVASSFDLTDRVRDNLHELELSLELLAELDFLNAKARFSLALNAVEPKLNTRGIVKLIQARHPVLEFHLQNEPPSDSDGDISVDLPEKVVPTDVHIGKTFRTLIITGPNTGGQNSCSQNGWTFSAHGTIRFTYPRGAWESNRYL